VCLVVGPCLVTTATALLRVEPVLTLQVMLGVFVHALSPGPMPPVGEQAW
jgi:hypothetical protein